MCFAFSVVVFLVPDCSVSFCSFVPGPFDVSPLGDRAFTYKILIVPLLAFWLCVLVNVLHGSRLALLWLKDHESLSAQKCKKSVLFVCLFGVVVCWFVCCVCNLLAAVFALLPGNRLSAVAISARLCFVLCLFAWLVG